MTDEIQDYKAPNQGTLEDKVIPIIQRYIKTIGFTDRKITDTPTDGLGIPNRNYVNAYGTTANRPKGSIMGEHYFDTDKSMPLTWNGVGWVNGSGIYQ